MSRFDVIDLAKLPSPAVVETLSFEVILAAMKADLVRRMPALADVLALESEPAVKILEACAYRELVLRQRINDAARAVMLATATGTDLDHLAALFGVARRKTALGNPNLRPAILPVYETDTVFRARTQLALEGYSTAGPVGAYVFHAFQASALVKDVDVTSPEPGLVQVAVLSTVGTGVPTGVLIALVQSTLNADEVRPLCDTVNVIAATVTGYQVTATLELQGGPESTIVLDEARAAVAAYVAGAHRLGHIVSRSGLFAALHRPGVLRATLTAPAADIVPASNEAGYCTQVTIGAAA